MLNPQIMCRQHLIAEHLECSAMCLGILKRKCKIDGFIRSNAIEILSAKERHDELVEEMLRRGYNHNSPFIGIPDDLLLYYSKEAKFRVNRKESLKLLLGRCENCRKLYNFNFRHIHSSRILTEDIENVGAYSIL